MAKLNGVTVLPAVSERIQYNGVEYVKTEEAAKAGDIIRLADDESSRYLTAGGFYEVTEVDSFDDAQIIDDDGDEYDTCGTEFVVYTKKAETKAEPSAKTGDKVRASSSVYTLGKRAPENDGYYGTAFWLVETDEKTWLGTKQFEVIESAAEDTITYEGRQYRKLKRKAAKGDLVIALEDGFDITDGNVYTVKSVDGGDITITDDVGDSNDCLDEYLVLEPVDSVEAAPSSGTIVHDGITYRKEARKAAAGERIIIVDKDEDERRYSNGDILTVARLDRDGDVRVDIGRYSNIFVMDREYNVLVPVETPLTGNLPEDYVIHDGAVYRKESRKAKVGEKIIVTKVGPDERAHLSEGEIGTVIGGGVRGTTRHVDFGYKKKYVQPAIDDEYSVLVPTDTVTLGGVDYALEKRKANVGDRVLVVVDAALYDPGEIFCVVSSDSISVENDKGNCLLHVSAEDGKTRRYLVLTASVPKTTTSVTASEKTPSNVKANIGDRIRITNAWGAFGKYANGDEFVVKSVREDGRVYVAEHDRPIAQSEYDVVTPVYNEVTRPANVAERIRIVNATLSLGNYVNGDEFIVTKVVRGKYGVNDHVRVDGVDIVILDTEYVVLESAYPVVERLAVGDYAKVVCLAEHNGATKSDAKIGEIYEVIGTDRSRVPYRGKNVVSGYTTWFNEKMVVRATDEEVRSAQAAAKRKSVKVGDYVRITEYESGDNVGTVVKVTYVNGDGNIDYASVRAPGLNFGASSDAYEPVTAAEAAKSAEEKRWAAIGRKVGEIREGDVVRVTNGCGGEKNGTIGTAVSNGSAFSMGIRGGIDPAFVGFVELIAPVESLFNRK